MRLFLFATLVATAYASPLVPDLNERAIHGNAFCSRVSKAVSNGGCQSVATSFCSSYLGSTVTTATATATTTVSTTTTTVTVTTTCGLPAPTLDKRGHRNPKPACFNSFTGKAALSSACSCLHITASTTTITSTDSMIATSTVTVTTATSPASFYVYATPLAMYGKYYAQTTVFTETEDATADIYSVTAGDGYLTLHTSLPGYFAEQDAGEDAEPIFFWDGPDIDRNAASFARVTCSIASAGDGTCPIYCTAPWNGGVTQYFDVVKAWALGQSSDGTEFTPLVVDAGGS